MDIDDQIKAANEFLKNEGCRLRIYNRQGRLVLRGQFPHPKTREMSRQWYNLGVPAVPSRLREAKIKALSIDEDILFNRFQWPSNRVNADAVTREEAIQKAEDEFFRRKKGQITTWRYIYQAHYAQLRDYERLNIDILYRYCLSKPADSRSRQTAITAMRWLANANDWTFSTERVRGAAKMRPTKEREPPTDEQVIELWERASGDPEWQLVVGLMATFGLRNHEVFTCDLRRFQRSQEPFVEVLKGKSGSGRAYAFHRAWIERFDLRNGKLPEIDRDLNHVEIGHRVTQHFRRKGYGRPYDLRHAYAIRMMDLGVPLDVAAKMMRHSVRVHTQTYQRWINRQRMDSIYEKFC